MAILLALLTAASYGTADFLGGVLTKRVGVVTVTFFSQLAGLVFLSVAVMFGGGELTGEAAAWGVAAGVCGAAGVPLLYRGLANGRMNVVAPTTALVAAAVPVAVGLVLGDRPGLLALIGVGAAMLAVVLVASGTGGQQSDSANGEGSLPGGGVLPAVGAGLMFGAVFVFFERAPDTSGLWPLVAARSATTLLIGVVGVAIGQAPRAGRGTGGTLVIVGALDAVANVSFVLAVRQGLLSIVGVLSSLYPVATVALARIVLKERATPVQLVGLVLAVGAVALIATG